MSHSISISSPLKPNISRLLSDLARPMEYAWTDSPYDKGEKMYFLWQPKFSTTVFTIGFNVETSSTILTMDGLASWEDYRLFPYLADCLSAQLCGKGIPHVFQDYDEEWTAEAIGETVAYVKVHLSLGKRYYLHNPLIPFQFIDRELLAQVATSYHSSTPRIYGYIQYLLKHHLVKTAREVGFEKEEGEYDENFEADVPQHVSIGRVKSWQTDGAETWESYAQEDVEMLLDMARRYENGQTNVAAVVLNDIGTLFHEGVGVERNGEKAAYWFSQAISRGDLLYAPSNLGDLHRKGCAPLPISLPDALAAYRLGEDPYAHYRIGQAYEEGWDGHPDTQKAEEWFARALAEGHHLAIRRQKEKSNTPTPPLPSPPLISESS